MVWYFVWLNAGWCRKDEVGTDGVVRSECAGLGGIPSVFVFSLINMCYLCLNWVSRKRGEDESERGVVCVQRVWLKTRSILSQRARNVRHTVLKHETSLCAPKSSSVHVVYTLSMGWRFMSKCCYWFPAIGMSNACYWCCTHTHEDCRHTCCRRLKATQCSSWKSWIEKASTNPESGKNTQ